MKRTKVWKLIERRVKKLSQRKKMTALQNKDIAGYDDTQYTLHVEQILFLSDITWIKLRLRMTSMVMQYILFWGKLSE